MIAIAADILSWIGIIGGVFFIVVGAVGVIRMPDIYTRLHSAGMTDTMGAGLMLIGMSFHEGITLVTVRLILIWGFLLFTSPIATYALSRAALHGEVTPVQVNFKGGSS
tara:strand:+ start:4289 stop:4615 length:327 start_codon:yes stop_codon:yes gene_type:complete